MEELVTIFEFLKNHIMKLNLEKKCNYNKKYINVFINIFS